MSKLTHTPSTCYNNPPQIFSLFTDDTKILNIAPQQTICQLHKPTQIKHTKIQKPPKVITVEHFSSQLITLNVIVTILLLILVVYFF